MGLIDLGGVVVHGNFTKPRRYKNGRPYNWFNKDWKAIIPYPFRWRAKLGKVECDCKEVIESYQPYYGSTYFHEERCAIMLHLLKYPQIERLPQYWEYDPRVIAMSS